MENNFKIWNLPEDTDYCKIIQLKFEDEFCVLCGTIEELAPEYYHYKNLENFLKEKNVDYPTITKVSYRGGQRIPSPEMPGKYKILGAGEWFYITHKFIEPNGESCDYKIPVNSEINLMMRKYFEKNQM